MLRYLSSRASPRPSRVRVVAPSSLNQHRSPKNRTSILTVTGKSSSQTHTHSTHHLGGPQHFQLADNDNTFGRRHQDQATRCYSTVLASSCSGSHSKSSYRTGMNNGHANNAKNRSNEIIALDINNSFPQHRHRHRHQHQQIRTKVFVSRHNQSLNITANAIVEYCNSHNIDTTDHRTTMSHVILKECPFCSKPTGNKASNQYKLYIQIGGGAYFCHRCGTSGSWYDLKSNVGGYSIHSMMGSGENHPQGQQAATAVSPKLQQRGGGGKDYRGASPTMAHSRSPPGLKFGGNGFDGDGDGAGNAASTSTASSANPAPLPMPKPRLSGYYSSRLLDPQNDDNPVLQYLQEERGLSRKTLRQYGVGRASYQFPSDAGGYQDAECVTFPWIMRTSEIQEQEALRGATFDDVVSTTKKKSDNPNAKPQQTAKVASPSKETKKPKDSKKSKDKKDAKDDDKDSDVEATSMDNDKLLTRRIKVRAVDNKSWQRLDPAGGGWGLFGWHTVPPASNEIVLTEGEYDAMAVHQATGKHAVSLPNGCRSLPLQVLPLLEQFDKIYLWMDSDQPGQEGAETFAKKLGVNRCYIVKCSQAKDANEALLKELDMESILADSKLMPHERILTFSDLRQDVLHELLQPELYMGSPVPSLPGFTKLIKGFRRGEVTVLTGPTGSGKTTFLGQVSLDLAEQGSNVLWGSFEIKNTRLLHKLLKQFARKPLPDHKDANASTLLGALADRFQNLPLYFMKFHGGSEVDEVLDAMEYAVYVNDVEHIILDNMQFMISRAQGGNSKFDKFDIQDMAVEKFRKFATEHNVHLTLVVHPRKEDETSKLNISSFYGSAKATQEADTVLILQHDGRRKYIDVKKNRFDGTLGFSPLYFQASSGRYVETEGGAPNNHLHQQQQQPPPQQIEFAPPRKAWRKKEEEEPEPPDLVNHWNNSLGLPP